MDTVPRELDNSDANQTHATSNPLGRVSTGDTRWIGSVRAAERMLNTDDLWEAKWHAIAAEGTAEPFQLIRLDAVAELRFPGTRDQLDMVGGRGNPHQPQTTHQLTPDTAEIRA